MDACIELNVFSVSSVPCSVSLIRWRRFIYISLCVCVCMQTSLLDLKEHASSLASSGLKKDSKLKSLEIALEQKREECLKLENHVKRVRSSNKEIRQLMCLITST